MSNHNGNANKMVDTPRTDEQINGKPCTRYEVYLGDALRDAWVPSQFARQLERELNAANAKIKRLEEATQERDKEWFQVIESILGFHPVSMTEALRIGIERVKKQKQRIKRLEEAGQRVEDAAHSIQDWSGTALGDALDELNKAKEVKP